MAKLVYVSDAFLDDFKTNFEEKYLPLYWNNDREGIESLFSEPGHVIESQIDFHYNDLILESMDPEANKKNMKIIWESLRDLSITEASSEKIWVALANTYYLDYHLDQLKRVVRNESLDEETKKRGIELRTIFTKKHGEKRSLMLTNISSLWWIAYYTYDDKSKNPFYYAERFMDGSYRGNAISYFSSNLVSNKEITLGTLEAIYELVDSGQMIENRYSYSGANKILNLIGGAVLIDHLTRSEIKDLVKDNLLKEKGIRKRSG